MASISLTVPATEQNFEETAYLSANPDVANLVKAGKLSNGRLHFEAFGFAERRRIRAKAQSLDPMRMRKISRVEPLLRDDMPFSRRGPKYDFLSDELREVTAIADTENVSQNSYGPEVHSLMNATPNGLILDCGSGKRDVYFDNVINYEIVDYDTTDILGVGEELPFIDGAFDAVISIAVLEHVRDPFKCATEISRVLKPGGKLLCSVPFLQPYHGYPHHYYNMTKEGAVNLFSQSLSIDKIEATGPALPIFSLSWILRSWAEGLSGEALEQFRATSVAELIGNPTHLQVGRGLRNCPKKRIASSRAATSYTPISPDFAMLSCIERRPFIGTLGWWRINFIENPCHLCQAQ